MHVEQIREAYFAGRISLEGVMHRSLSDCYHCWIECGHDGVDSPGTHKRCIRVNQFGYLSHHVCIKCGADRFSDNWGAIAAEVLGL